MQVIAAGRITVFPRDGQYQLYCVRLTPEGAGDLHVAFEQLEGEAAAGGPVRPGPQTAFARLSTAHRPDHLSGRGGGAGHVAHPGGQISPGPGARPAGAGAGGGAAEEIAAALDWANLHQAADLIITGRGAAPWRTCGPLTRECVARAIYRSQIPVISAVGHEPDVTIADFVADLRAATPPTGRSWRCPTRMSCTPGWTGWPSGWRRGPAACWPGAGRIWSGWAAAGCSPTRGPISGTGRLLLDYQGQRLGHGAGQILSRARERLARDSAALDAMSPLKVLGRGYSIARK